MPKIEHAGYEIEVTPFVEEAVAHLGIFRREAIPYLAEGVAKFFNYGKTGYEMRRTGEELPDDRKLSQGLGRRTRMARDFWDALTDEARVDPINAPEIVFLRIKLNLFREGNHRQLDDHYQEALEDGDSSFLGEVSLQTDENNCCSAASERLGKLVPTLDRPRLPLLECDRAVCQCRYDINIEDPV